MKAGDTSFLGEETLMFERLGRCYFEIQSFRRPHAAEYFVSGAIPKAYQAPNQLSDSFWIVKPTFHAEPATGFQKGKRVV